MKYSELGLHPDLARGILEAGYTECMPVQKETFPHAFKGLDIYAQSQTGTGKTAAFLVSIFQRIMSDDGLRHKKALILAPTRELAVQIEAEAKKLGKYLEISSGCFYGGVSYTAQLEMLKNNVQIIIGTPGRIIDLVNQGKMLLRDAGFLVVDEADRMFDMGFIDDLRKLIRFLPPREKRQNFLYSATLGFRVKNLAWEYMNEPKEIVIEAENVTVDMVSQELYHTASEEKLPLLLGILKREKASTTLIFCNQKNMTEELSRRLSLNGIKNEFIMGDLPQSKRLGIIKRLKEGKLPVLVATDVAARGLDVSGLDLVINYDLPMDPESYVHRIGRTARAGASGKAISLACEKFVYGLSAIEDYIESKIPVFPITDELLETDNSAGMAYRMGRSRTQTGRQPTPGRQRSSRPATRGQAGRQPASRQQASRQPAKRKPIQPVPSRPAGASGGSSSQKRPMQPKQPARSTKTSGAARTMHSALPESKGKNPYALTSEERMAMYRKKYSAKPANEAKAPQKEEKEKGILLRIAGIFKKKKS